MNHTTDEISRLETTGAYERDLEDNIPVLMLETTRKETFFLWKTCDEMPMISKIIPSVLDIEIDDKPEQPKTEEFIWKQATESFCKKMDETVRTMDSFYTYEKYSFLVRRARIYGSIQKVFPKEVQATMLYLSAISVLGW